MMLNSTFQSIRHMKMKTCLIIDKRNRPFDTCCATLNNPRTSLHDMRKSQFQHKSKLGLIYVLSKCYLSKVKHDAQFDISVDTTYANENVFDHRQKKSAI